MGTGGAASIDDPEAEEALWTALRSERSTRARGMLFDRYAGFARRIAARRHLDRHGDIEFADLCQLAYAGLLEAIDRFDPQLGASFSSYAERRINGSILDGLGAMSEVRRQISFRNRVRMERAKSLAVENPELLKPQDALAALVDAAVGLAVGFMFEGTTVYIAEERPGVGPDGYESLAWRETVQRVRREIEALPERERLILQRHYLEGVNFETLAALLGLTKGRVSQIHRAALLTLRQRLSAIPHFRAEQ